MSETIDETGGAGNGGEGGGAVADEAPTKVYICPACGWRYDDPTTCANGHAPTETVEYDRATVAAADAGDAQAIAAVNATATAAAGDGMAGVVPAEATPTAPVVPQPVPAAVVPAEAPVVEAAPVAEAATGPDAGTIFADFETAIAAAVANAKNALGL